MRSRAYLLGVRLTREPWGRTSLLCRRQCSIAARASARLVNQRHSSTRGAFAAEIGGNAARQGLAAALFLAGTLDRRQLRSRRGPLPRRATNEGSLSMTTKLRQMSLDVHAETIAVAEGDGRSTNRLARVGSSAGDCRPRPSPLPSQEAYRSPFLPPGTVRGRAVGSDSGAFRDLHRRVSARLVPPLLVARLGRPRFLNQRVAGSSPASGVPEVPPDPTGSNPSSNSAPGLGTVGGPFRPC
jgi:hypothetical protein